MQTTWNCERVYVESDIPFSVTTDEPADLCGVIMTIIVSDFPGGPVGPVGLTQIYSCLAAVRIQHSEYQHTPVSACTQTPTTHGQSAVSLQLFG